MKAIDIDGFDEILLEAENKASTDWEMSFVQQIRDKYDDYEDEMFVSDKQVEILERIAGL